MHDYAGLTYGVTFSAAASGLTVAVNASVDCGGICPALTYDWDWGDGSQDLGSTASSSHTYGAAGTYSITLSVRLSGLIAGSAVRSVTVVPPDLPPTAAGTCTWSANTWTMTVRDTSTDTDATGVQTVTVDWADGSTKSIGGPGVLFTHTYLTPGTYTPTLKAIDTALKVSDPVYTCPTSATPAYFTISGTVYKKDGTTPVASAMVSVKKGTVTQKTVSTAANGTFTVSSLKPATYTLTVSKPGYNFGPAPQATITIGPDSTGNRINAVSP